MANHYLFEIFTEEIPARFQEKAHEAFRAHLQDFFAPYPPLWDQVQSWITPRRLGVAILGAKERTPGFLWEKKGPPLSASPIALEKFCQSFSLEISKGASSTCFQPGDCQQKEIKGRPFWWAAHPHPGHLLKDLFLQWIHQWMDSFCWPQTMYWGVGKKPWVRPIRNLLCLQEKGGLKTLLPWAWDPKGIALKTQDFTYIPNLSAKDGFLEKVFPLSIPQYLDQMADLGFTLLPSQRRHIIKNLLQEAGGDLTVPDRLLRTGGLLDEVNGLIESPIVLKGAFHKSFLSLPPQVLMTAMETHQRYFPLVDKEGQIQPYFLVVANRLVSSPEKTCLPGYEQVLEARLKDALFFWQKDTSLSLEAHQKAQQERVFLPGLGTFGQWENRLMDLCAQGFPHHQAPLQKALKVFKGDLGTQMVQEFPELQGTMGKAYYLFQGGDPEVAESLEEQYYPHQESDFHRPKTISLLGRQLGLLTRLDYLVGLIGLGKIPSGSKDPFSLRRALTSLLWLLSQEPWDLADLVAKSLSAYQCQGFLKAVSFDSLWGGVLFSMALDRIPRMATQNILAIPEEIKWVIRQTPFVFREILEKAQKLHSLFSQEEGKTFLNSLERVGNLLPKGVSIEPTSQTKLTTYLAAWQGHPWAQSPSFQALLNWSKSSLELSWEMPQSYWLQAMTSFSQVVTDLLDHTRIEHQDPNRRQFHKETLSLAFGCWQRLGTFQEGLYGRP